MVLIVWQPNAYFKGNPDIGYIWVFIGFSDSLDLLDQKKSYLPLPSVEQFFLSSLDFRASRPNFENP